MNVDLTDRLSRMRRRALTAFGVTFLIILGIIIAASISVRQQEIDNAARQGSYLSALLEEQTLNTISAIDLVLSWVAREVYASIDGFGLDQAAIARLMTAAGEAPFEIDGFILVDDSGETLASTLPSRKTMSVRALVFPDQHAEPTAENRVRLGIATHAGDDAELVIFRRLVTADGQFAGVAAAVTHPEKIRGGRRKLAAGSGWRVRLQLDDGTILAGGDADALRANEPTDRPSPLREGSSRTAETRYVLDGQEWLGFHRQVADLPLLASASIAVDNVLTDWRQRSFQFSLVMLLLLGALGCSLALMYRHRREAAAHTHMLALQSAAMNAAANAIVITDGSGRVEWANEAFESLTGTPLRDVLGKPPPFFRLGPDNAAIHRDLWDTVKSGRVWRGEFRDDASGGAAYEVQQTVTPITGHDGRISHLIVIHEDIRERKAVERELYHLANFDVQTGLPNRLLLRDRLERAVALSRRRRSPLAISLFDLDNFKDVNDTLGHPLGDELLKAVSDRVSRAVRQSDTVARLGGDEFVIVMPDAGEAVAARIADRVRELLSAPFDVHGHLLHVGASIGTAFYPEDGEEADTLLRNADLAMYAAKAAGRDCVRRYTPDLTQRVEERRTIESNLKSAIDREEFHLVYQPQMELATGRVVGVEALLRWHLNGNEEVSPDRFIPIAESTGQVIAIDQWVIRSAARDAAAWRGRGAADVRVAVNISAMHLHRSDFADFLLSILKETGLTPNTFAVELTETAFLAPSIDSERQLERLQAAGVRVALDDFGTGYSSLSYLRRLPIDSVKIDRYFVRGLGRDDADEAIVTGIVSLGRAFGLTTIAEGAETEAHLQRLRSLGCDIVQGWVVAPPMLPDTFIRWLTEHQAMSA